MLCLLLAVLAAGCGRERSEPAPLRVAVASNFSATCEAVLAAWLAAGGGPVEISTGATGVLTTQIRNGAPYDVFLAADARRPELLAAEGTATGPAVVYAVGELTLWAPDAEAIGPEDLAAVSRLAVANPDVAPYGVAALEALRALGLEERLSARLVRGTNIAQTFQFAATGNADAAFVATAQIRNQRGAFWRVPAELHGPVVQKAVPLSDDPRAHAFLEFLGSAVAREIIASHGYGLEAAP